MKTKIWTIVFIAIALVVAILSLLSNQNAQMYAAYITHFFVSIIPILGTAALLKYITSCGQKDKSCCTTEKSGCDDKKGHCSN